MYYEKDCPHFDFHVHHASCIVAGKGQVEGTAETRQADGKEVHEGRMEDFRLHHLA